MPEGPAAAAAILVMLRLGASGFHGFPMLPGLGIALASGACLLASVPARRAWAALAGLLAGVAMLFRQDIGGYAVVIEVGILIAWRWLGAGARRSATAGPSSGGLLPYLVALAAVIAPPALFFLWRVGPAGLWQELVVYPRSVVIARLTVPFPGPIPDFRVLFSVPGWRWGHVERAWGSWTDFYVPLLAYAWTAASVLWSVRRGGRAAAARRETWALLFLTAMGLALFGYAVYRFDPIHAVATFVPAVVLAAYWLWRSLATARATAIAACVVLPVFVYLWVGVPLSRWLGGVLQAGPPVCAAPLGRAGCVALDDSQREAVDFVRRRTTPGEPIFVGVARRHPIPQNDTSFYFLADRPPATRNHELLAEAATSAAIQEEMIARLRRPELRYIVLYAGFDDPTKPEGSGEGSGAPLVDAFVREAFRRAAQFGPYFVLEKR
jgi:hypothetical protein